MMKIQMYDIILSARIAKFKELNEYEQGDILRSFVDFMKEKGLQFDFLVANNAMETRREK